MATNPSTAFPGPMPESAELTARMVGIGMNFAAMGRPNADIEATLLYASQLGLDEYELRVLMVLSTWLFVHHKYINTERLVRLVKQHDSRRVQAYWAAVGAWLSEERGLAQLAGLYVGPPVDVLPVGTEFQLTRRGEDPRFAGSPLRVPRGTLRERMADVLTPETLIKRHLGYRNRVLMGPSWRADVWTVLEQAPTLTVAEVAQRADCSVEIAWRVAQDFRLLQHGDAEHAASSEPAES